MEPGWAVSSDACMLLLMPSSCAHVLQGGPQHDPHWEAHPADWVGRAGEGTWSAGQGMSPTQPTTCNICASGASVWQASSS